MASDRRAEFELRIRAAMGRLLAGEVPEGHKCDVTSLCLLAAVPRATFYRSYPHLRTEFQESLGRLRSGGHQPDPRLAQIEGLKVEIVGLRERVSESDRQIVELTTFRSTALSRLATQHDEIVRLRARVETGNAAHLRNLSS